jgi:hypothetical protein
VDPNPPAVRNELLCASIAPYPIIRPDRGAAASHEPPKKPDMKARQHRRPRALTAQRFGHPSLSLHLPQSTHCFFFYASCIHGHHSSQYTRQNSRGRNDGSQVAKTVVDAMMGAKTRSKITREEEEN